MTEMIRELVRAMRGPKPEQAALTQGHAELSAELQVPAGRHDWDPVVAQLGELLSSRAAALRLSHTVNVGVRTAPGTSLDVAIGGRPVAVGIDPELAVDPRRLFATIDDRLRRRLSVLLGDSPNPVLAYLTDHGFAVEDDSDTPPGLDSWAAADAEDSDLSAEELGERELAARRPRLRVEVAEQTLRRTDARPKALPALRAALFAREGIQFPDLELAPISAPPGTVRLIANDIQVDPYPLPRDANWSDVVNDVLRPFLRHHAAWFVANLDIKRAFEELRLTLPDMGETFLECYPRQYMLTACVRDFVRQGRPVRNLSRILWLLMEIGPASIVSEKLSFSENPLLRDPLTPPQAQRDPRMVAARVRKCLAEDSWRAGVETMSDPVRIPVEIETALLAADDLDELAAAEWAAVRAAIGYPSGATVVTSSVQASAPVHRALRALPNRLRVVAAQELPPGHVVSC